MSDISKDVTETVSASVSEIKRTTSAYTKGALVGGIALSIWALITRRNVLLWGTIGVIGGGFIAYRVKEAKVKGSNSPIGFKVKEKEDENATDKK